MKPLTVIAAAVIAILTFGLAVFAAESASAQNAAEIGHARGGASCPHCNLFQADFSNLELKDRNFAGARLRQADFSAAVMNHTSFAGADLRDLNAYGAVFTGASFAGANLTNASLVGTYLEGANFRGANLTGANFSGAEMDRATGLTQAQLAGACGDSTTTLPRGLHLRTCG
ncbi:MAG TPA: pentapeptide repeat-containing protein [Caulobacteraceae bacterium]|jgi:uncharacterized protein YjbI with pentapeptide repeats